MLISKKDLLTETGISYGQLYRWKREGLIPEDWFIKRPSFTGQETYFPREKVLARIKTILELKDGYSLEELSAMFTPELSKRHFTPAELEGIDEIDANTVALVNEKSPHPFTFPELLLLVALSRAKEHGLDARSAADCFCGVAGRLGEIGDDTVMSLVRAGGEAYVILLCREGAAVYDGRLANVCEYELGSIKSELMKKYGNTFTRLTTKGTL